MGQHRDLKINYDYLAGINSTIKAYIDALTDLKTASKKFANVIKAQEGKTFTELDNEFEDAIVINNTELIEILTDVHSSLESYMADMQSYIAPENSAALCRVDRNDIAWNIMQISQLPYGYVGEHPCVPSHYYWDEFENPLSPNVAEVHARNEERRRKRERNYNKLVSFYQNTLTTTAKELSEEVNKINDIHEKYVVEYENTDDIYKSNLGTLYDSIKTWKDVLGDIWEGTKDFFRGFATGVVDLIKGLKAPLEIMLALNPAVPLPLGVRFALLYDGGKDLYAAGKAFIEDPENTVGAIFQNMADTADEEGVAFTAGYATEKVVEIILAKKLGEAMEGGKVSEAVGEGVEGGSVAKPSSEYTIPDVEKLKTSQTVQNHMNDVIKKGPNAGQLSRPYIDTNGTKLLLREIMESAEAVPDKILTTGLRWDVSGTFRGATGTWELVIDMSSDTIVHFNFVAK